MGAMTDIIIEETNEAGAMEDAAQELFTTGYFSWKGWSQKEKWQISLELFVLVVMAIAL